MQSDQLSPIGTNLSPATSLSLSKYNLILYGGTSLDLFTPMAPLVVIGPIKYPFYPIKNTIVKNGVYLHTCTTYMTILLVATAKCP